MTFGAKLQTLRADAGWSQEELASRLNVSRQAVSKWELGKTVPDAATIVAVSELFRVSTDYLLKDWETAPPESSGSAEAPTSPAPVPAAGTPSNASSDITPDEPGRIRAACVLLNCGNVLSLTLLLFSLFKLVFLQEDSVRPLVFVLVTAPILLSVVHGLLWNTPFSPAALRRYRRGAASAVVLAGFSAASLLGYHEVIDDLLLGHVEGVMSLPILLVLTTLLLWIFWLLGCLLAHHLIRALKSA